MNQTEKRKPGRPKLPPGTPRAEDKRTAVSLAKADLPRLHAIQEATGLPAHKAVASLLSYVECDLEDYMRFLDENEKEG